MNRTNPRPRHLRSAAQHLHPALARPDSPGQLLCQECGTGTARCPAGSRTPRSHPTLPGRARDVPRGAQVDPRRSFSPGSLSPALGAPRSGPYPANPRRTLLSPQVSLQQLGGPGNVGREAQPARSCQHRGTASGNAPRAERMQPRATPPTCAAVTDGQPARKTPFPQGGGGRRGQGSPNTAARPGSDLLPRTGASRRIPRSGTDSRHHPPL